MTNEMLGNEVKEPVVAVVILTNDQGGRLGRRIQVFSLRTGRNVGKECDRTMLKNILPHSLPEI